MKKTRLIILFFSLYINGCNYNKPPSLDSATSCVFKFLVENISEMSLQQFKEKNGLDVYDEWICMTTSLAKDRYILEECGFDKYMYENETGLGSLKGEMLFVYFFHDYVKNGEVNKAVVRERVSDLLLEYQKRDYVFDFTSCK